MWHTLLTCVCLHTPGFSHWLHLEYKKNILGDLFSRTVHFLFAYIQAYSSTSFQPLLPVEIAETVAVQVIIADI